APSRESSWYGPRCSLIPLLLPTTAAGDTRYQGDRKPSPSSLIRSSIRPVIRPIALSWARLVSSSMTVSGARHGSHDGVPPIANSTANSATVPITRAATVAAPGERSTPVSERVTARRGAPPPGRTNRPATSAPAAYEAASFTPIPPPQRSTPHTHTPNRIASGTCTRLTSVALISAHGVPSTTSSGSAALLPRT